MTDDLKPKKDEKDVEYKCDAGRVTVTHKANGAWIGHRHPWWCPCGKGRSW